MTDAIEPTGRTLPEIESALDEGIGRLARHVRVTMAEAWHNGCLLVEAKPKVGRGLWLTWLEGRGLKPRAAQYLMEIAGHPLAELELHGTISEALHVLRVPKRLTAPAQIRNECALDDAPGEQDTVSDLDSLTTDELTAQFRQHRAEFKELAPELVAQWWHLGGVLIQIKSELSADDFAVWCAEGEITPTESSRMIDLNNRYSEGVVASLDHESIVLTWLVEGVETEGE